MPESTYIVLRLRELADCAKELSEDIEGIANAKLWTTLKEDIDLADEVISLRNQVERKSDWIPPRDFEVYERQLVDYRATVQKLRDIETFLHSSGPVSQPGLRDQLLAVIKGESP